MKKLICILYFLAILTPGFSQTVIEKDSLALVALYNSTNGPGWTKNDNWLTGPVKDWYGITTFNGRVTQIDLYENQLIGNIPPEIGNLSSLVFLYLYSNQLSGNIPAEMGNLSGLITMLLSGNELSGNIPPEIGNLSNLSGLSLHNNQLSGNIPAEIGNLSNLTGLGLSSNKFSGIIPAELGNLTKITMLDLGGNLFTGNIPIEICSLTSLENLILYSNQLSGNIPAEIGSLTSLTILQLSGNEFNGNIPVEIGNLSNLEWLCLDNNKITGNVPSEIGNLTNLYLLNLSNNQLTGDLPSEIGELTNLKTVYIDNNQFSFSNLYSSGIVHNEIDFFYYSPQNNIPTVYRETLNDSIKLWVNKGHNQNEFTWYRYDEVLELEDDSVLVVGIDEAGSYSCHISNPLYPKLTFKTEPVLVIEPVSEKDSLVLVAFYNATSGPEWTTIDNWLSSPVMEWEGISVKDNRVSGIELRSSEIKGRLPKELFTLDSLKQLIIYDSDCNFGEIPAEIGNLTNLEYLSLKSNHITGVIPPEIGNLDKLKYLRISASKLSGNIPAEICNLSNLETLNLSYSLLSGEIPTEIGNLLSLKDLLLYRNQLSGIIPSEIGNLKNLERLHLYRNHLNGKIPLEICSLSALTQLYLDYNQLSGKIPSEIGNLSNLERLNLQNNQFSGAIPAEIGNITKLKILYLHNNQLSGTIPVEIGNFINLINPYTYIKMNCFNFDDLVKSGMEHANITYYPQNNIPAPEVVHNGDHFDMVVNNNSSENLYQWYKDEVAYSGATDTILSISGTEANSIYYCKITNPLFPKLTLFTNSVIPSMISNGINDAPVADVGEDQETSENYDVYIDFSNSYDPEGDSISYNWILPVGIETTQNEPGSFYFRCPQVPADSTLEIILTVSDGELVSEPDTVFVKVIYNNDYIPVADAGFGVEVEEGQLVQLDGSESYDEDKDEIYYNWSGPNGIVLSDATSVNPVFSAPEVQTDSVLKLVLTVNDGENDSKADTVLITVKNNEPPLANAGSNIEVEEGVTVQLDGTASTDPEGKDMSYLWSSPGGIELNDVTISQPSFTAPEVIADSVLTLVLTVNDGIHESEADTVAIKVINNPEPQIHFEVTGNGEILKYGEDYNLICFKYSDSEFVETIIEPYVLGQNEVIEPGEGSFILKAIPLVPGYLPTYASGAALIENAEMIDIASDVHEFISINLIEELGQSGEGVISGYVYEGYGDGEKGISVTNSIAGMPLSNAQVVLQDENGSVALRSVITDENGFYLFSGLPNGTYMISVEIPGYEQKTSHTPTITEEEKIVEDNNYLVFAEGKSVETGIDNYGKLFEIVTYPVPVKEKLNIEFSKQINEEGILSLYNSAGIIVKQKELNSASQNTITIDCQDLSSGLYILKISSGNINTVRKIIKE